MLKKLTINLSTNYLIYIGDEILDNEFVNDCKQLTERLVIVTDSNLMLSLGLQIKKILTAENISCELFSIPAGENNKTRETKQLLEDQLLAKNYGRDTCLIALGGGVVTDIVGFVAATYCRGIPVIYVPTTLLAMVDASIGGKTGVDTPFGKNLIGTFYQPQAVFIDINTLNTLPQNEWKNGLVETLKHGLIADAELVNLLKTCANTMTDKALLSNVIYQSCWIKKTIIEQDEHDLGIRQLLNFGHTIGHAIETIENYRLSHGEAVAIGMIVEAYLSVLMGFATIELVAEIEVILKSYELSLKTSAFANPDVFKQQLKFDKKSLKNVAQFVLLDFIGKPHQENNQYVFSVSDEILDLALQWAHERF